MVQSAADTTMLRRYGQVPQRRQVGANAPPNYGPTYASGSSPQGPRSVANMVRKPNDPYDERAYSGNRPPTWEENIARWDKMGYGQDDQWPQIPWTTPTTPGGGGRGGGGGGGGGAAAAPTMSQGTLDAMLAALRGGKPQDLNMPAYQGTPLSPFSTAPWDTMRSSVDQAAGMDRAASTQGYDQLASRLGANFMNPYTNAPVQGSPELQNAMINLMQGSGARPGAGQDVVSGENAYSRNSDDAFRHLLGVLGAGAQQSQDSRLAQVGMDANTAQRGIDASAFGMRSAADMQQANALRDYTQRADDRTYADNQLAQQWQREQAQGNWAQQNQSRQQMLSPLLELIGSTNGAGLDLSGLMAMLQGGQ